MKRTLLRIGQTLSRDRPVIDPQCLNFSCCVRTVSTNSAIHRGIRRSRHGGGRETRPSRYGGADERTAGAVSRQGGIGSTRPRKPNHQNKQDVEEMESLVNTRVERMTPQQRQYRMAGRAPKSTAPIQSRAPGKTRTALSYQKYSDGARIVRDSSERTTRYDGTKSQHGPWVPSNSRDRADRRDLQVYSDQDRNSTREHEKTSSAPRARKRSFDDRSSSSKEGSFMDAVYRCRDRGVPASSSTEDSIYRRDSLSPGQSRAGGHTYPWHEEASGQDGNRDRSFSSGDFGTVIRKCPSTSRADDSDLDGKSTLQYGGIEEPRRLSTTPLAVPYTTPASEFLYGTSVVVAALRASKRQLYKLYIHDGEHRESGARDTFVRKLALSRQVPVTHQKWVSMMDKMSLGRAHNVG